MMAPLKATTDWELSAGPPLQLLRDECCMEAEFLSGPK